ncbi:unnamed protein product [Ectocarpus fasciculatus]
MTWRPELMDNMSSCEADVTSFFSACDYGRCYRKNTHKEEHVTRSWRQRITRVSIAMMLVEGIIILLTGFRHGDHPILQSSPLFSPTLPSVDGPFFS